METAKEKRARLQVIISVLILTIVFFAELYLMINLRTQWLPIVSLAVVALGVVYMLSNALLVISAERDAKRNAHYESIAKSEKASYIMLKKSFDEIEGSLNELRENAKFPAEEIVNAQKGIAKVIINRSKENADAIISSNDQVLERLDEVEETQNTKFTSLSKEQRMKLSDFGTQTDIKLQDLLMQLKDTELRLNQAIMSGTKVTYVPMDSAPIMQTVSVEEEQPVQIAETMAEEESLPVEELLPVEESIPIEEPLPIEEPIPVEEPMPDMSDPNKMMSPDDIAALFANMAGDTDSEEKDQIENEIAATEDKPPMPDLSDPNKVMSPEEIAALIANL